MMRGIFGRFYACTATNLKSKFTQCYNGIGLDTAKDWLLAQKRFHCASLRVCFVLYAPSFFALGFFPTNLMLATYCNKIRPLPTSIPFIATSVQEEKMLFMEDNLDLFLELGKHYDLALVIEEIVKHKKWPENAFDAALIRDGPKVVQGTHVSFRFTIFLERIQELEDGADANTFDDEPREELVQVFCSDNFSKHIAAL
jgi:hypothetical protein